MAVRLVEPLLTAVLGSFGRFRLAVELPNKRFRMRPVIVPDLLELVFGRSASRDMADAVEVARGRLMVVMRRSVATASAGAELVG